MYVTANLNTVYLAVFIQSAVVSRILKQPVIIYPIAQFYKL